MVIDVNVLIFQLKTCTITPLPLNWVNYRLPFVHDKCTVFTNQRLIETITN